METQNLDYIDVDARRKYYNRERQRIYREKKRQVQELCLLAGVNVKGIEEDIQRKREATRERMRQHRERKRLKVTGLEAEAHQQEQAELNMNHRVKKKSKMVEVKYDKMEAKLNNRRKIAKEDRHLKNLAIYKKSALSSSASLVSEKELVSCEPNHRSK